MGKLLASLGAIFLRLTGEINRNSRTSWWLEEPKRPQKYLGLILGTLGFVLGSCWGILGICCDYCGTSWGYLGAMLEHRAAFFEHFT